MRVSAHRLTTETQQLRMLAIGFDLSPAGLLTVTDLTVAGTCVLLRPLVGGVHRVTVGGCPGGAFFGDRGKRSRW